MFKTDDSRWQAIVSRDRDADGHFYYGVVTTGVYCIPSCPSRAKNRENVRIYTTIEDAQKDGLRACKRCKPDEKAIPPYFEQVIQACRMIEQAEETPSLDTLAENCGLSSFHFHRIFKSVTGITPKAYAAAHKAGKLRDALGKTATITDAIYEAGYSASSRFYERAQERLGMKPQLFKAGGNGIHIRFAVGACSLGAILVAATNKGICAIDLGDDAEALIQDFEGRFHGAELSAGDAEFDRLVATAIAVVDTPGAKHTLPLDIQGTAFQEKVWSILRSIPAGETITYSELAEKAGNPKAVRAAASACASNKIAIAIPCHRVVRKGGELSGYRWGIERKATLLEQESLLSTS